MTDLPSGTQVMSTTAITVFLVGDVMLGRGIDQILKYSCDPVLYEGSGIDANGYVTLAVRENGPLPDKSERGVSYVWGDALNILQHYKPDVRIINLETAVTLSKKPWPKGINYRMHPKNIDVIQTAEIDCCVLSNNHVLDWDYEGLAETLATLKGANIAYSGAGHNSTEAEAPAIFEIAGKGRLLVFAGGHDSSGVPDAWKAKESKPGINVLDIHKVDKSVEKLKEQVKKVKSDGDVVMLSIHWGGNWGWEIDDNHRNFAHAAIDKAGIDLIHGHSSHHIKGIEIYKGKLIIYGCGDFLDDYEGITGQGCDAYRDDLSFMYFPQIATSNGKLMVLRMVPTRIKHMRIHKADEKEIQWLMQTMHRECGKLGTWIKRVKDELHLVIPDSSDAL